MVGGAAGKGKRARGAKAGEHGGASAAAVAATATPAPSTPRPAAVVKAAATVANGAGADDSEIRNKGKKSKRKREKYQAQEKGCEGGGVDGLRSCSAPATQGNNHATTKDAKRRKSGGHPRAPEIVVVATATAAAAAANTPGVGAAVSSQPRTHTCTSKVAEYAATCDVTPPVRGAKKKRKLKDKRQKTGGRSSPSRNRHAPPPFKKTATPIGNNADNGDDDGDDNDDNYESPALEGIFHNGAMYLVDARRRVFSAQRDGQGNLVEVGTFDDGRGKVVMIGQPPSGGPPDGTTSLAVAVEGVVPSEGAPDSTGFSGPAGSSSSSSSSNKKTKNKGKKEAEAGVLEEEKEGVAGTETGNIIDYPFEVEELDHCETSERAYADISPLLLELAAGLGKTPQELVIYDPYYCQGSTIVRLASLGFPRVHNRKEDFYEVVKNGNIPEHDVVVTNPPFSGEHVSKILSFCTREGAKPWFLLLPNYVYLKDYYESSLGRRPGRGATLPFYLTPPKRYTYYSPAGSRLKVKSSERKTSPFNTFWYIRLGDGGVTSKILQSYDAVSRKAESDARCCVARTTQQIPYKMMDSNDPRRKKARDRQRSIDRVRKKKSEWVVG
ncbi:unnamed protein product [Pylaiella littoralis]